MHPRCPRKSTKKKLFADRSRHTTRCTLSTNGFFKNVWQACMPRQNFPSDPTRFAVRDGTLFRWQSTVRYRASNSVFVSARRDRFDTFDSDFAELPGNRPGIRHDCWNRGKSNSPALFRGQARFIDRGACCRWPDDSVCIAETIAQLSSRRVSPWTSDVLVSCIIIRPLIQPFTVCIKIIGEAFSG